MADDPNYHPNNNLFHSLLEINQCFLTKAYEMQNKQNYEESIKCLEKIYKNFHILGTIADQIPYTPLVIKENREMLSQAHTEKISERFPYKLKDQYEFEKSNTKNNGKKKQKKTKWSPEEQDLFLQGLELYGAKNLKKVTEHVRSRTINQVRSHLQKHQIKINRLKEKNSDSNCNLNLNLILDETSN